MIYYVEMNQIVTFIPHDTNYRELLKELGTNSHIIVHSTDSYVDLLDMITVLKPQVVIVALFLCGIHADQVITQIREISFRTRVLGLLKQYTVADRMSQFKQGADDLMAVPYSPKECSLRVRRLLAIQRVFTTKSYSLSNQVTYNATNSVLQLCDKQVPIRRREGQVLSCLAQHKNIVISREQLAKWIWGDDSLVSLSTIDVYVKRLREILGDDADKIKTVRGLGYQLIADTQ
jgi:DNA-binding response OmpR family regulator